ncbi:hypothetical protein [Lactococcus sp. DD01]|uniref:hypothetical protein n=1 Tax=Lactococcus sp. DD01 TaxID=1776443 RepID=UPI0007768BB2|nr:hypothetical protein [Lactococcus sp. DD01]
MKKIYDETYTSGSQSSRNIWYSDCLLHQDSEFGSIANLSIVVQELIVDRIQSDIEEKGKVTEINWYFYDCITTEDANSDKVRTSLMLNLKNEIFIAHINISDYTFAIGFKNVQHQIKLLEETLNK